MASNKKVNKLSRSESVGDWLKSFAFGGDKWRSLVTLIALQMAAVLVMGSAIFSAIFGGLVGLFTTSYQWHVFYKTAFAIFWRYAPFMNSNKPIDFMNFDGRFINGVHSPALIKHVFETPELSEKFFYVSSLGVVALVVTIVSIIFLARYFKEKGDRDQRDEFLRGQSIVSTDDLKEMITKPSAEREKECGGPSPVTVGGIPIPSKLLGRNFLFCGGMGAGKTVGIDELLDCIIAWKKKAVIRDPYGEIYSKRFRPGKDVMLCPVDARSEKWTVFTEMKDSTDVEAMAKPFIAQNGSDSNPEFTNAAAMLIKDLFIIVRKMGGTMKDVRNIATQTSLPNLFKLLKDNNADSCGTIDPENPKTSHSIRFTLVAQEAIRFFKFFDDMNATFSIRDFIRGEDDSILYLVSNTTMENICNPFVNAWLEIAYLEAMSNDFMPENRGSTEIRLFMVLDEFASLGKVEVIKKALTEGRKFGICTVIGIQDANLLLETYGENLTRTILGNLQTKVILRTEESKSAEWLADMLGKEEIEEVSESASLGVDGNRDGFSLSAKRTEYHVVSYSQIMKTRDNRGWVKISADHPVGEIVLMPKNREVLYPDFVKRTGLELENINPTAKGRAFLDMITAEANEDKDVADNPASTESDLPFDTESTATPAPEPKAEVEQNNSQPETSTPVKTKTEDSFEGFL